MKRYIALGLVIVLLTSLLSGCSIGKCSSCGQIGITKKVTYEHPDFIVEFGAGKDLCDDCIEILEQEGWVVTEQD